MKHLSSAAAAPLDRRRLLGLGLAGASTLGLAGCGLSSSGFVPRFGQGSIQPVDGADQVPLSVVSKNFTEQLILGKMLVLAASAAGYAVKDMTNIPGSQALRNMMLSGDAHLTVEYTGTAWLTYMGHEKGIPDPREQWRAVKEEDRANGLIWGEPGRFNNTYALAVRKDYADAKGLRRISDIHSLPKDERTLCVEAEFNSRSDGLNPMLEHYGLDRGTEVPDGNIGLFDTGAIYTATADGTCNIGEIFSTDGRVLSLGLTVLEDDKDYFPAYNGTPVYNQEVLERSPGLEGAIDPVIGQLTNDVLRELNRQVDVDGREPVDVAFDWMVDRGFITRP